jgi:hypothetical protein
MSSRLEEGTDCDAFPRLPDNSPNRLGDFTAAFCGGKVATRIEPKIQMKVNTVMLTYVGRYAVCF